MKNVATEHKKQQRRKQKKMASLKELIVNIKTKLNQNELVQGVNAIKQRINEIKDPHVTPKVNISPALAEFRKMKQAYQETKLGIKEAYQETKLEIKTKTREEVGKKFASGVSTTETLALGAGVAYAVKQAVDLDTAMLGVKKQVTDVVDSMGNYTDKGERIKNMIRDISKESGTAQSSVAGLFEEAGKSGIQGEADLKSYAMGVLYAKSAFDLTAESLPEFSRSVSEYQAAAKLSNDETRVFIDKLNYLDDQVANVNGPSLLDFQKRTASTFNNAGVSEDLGLSIGATAQNAGLPAEVAATAFNAVIPKLLTAKETFKKNDPFTAIGMTASQVQAGMVKDADKMVLTIMEKAKSLDKVKKANFLNEIAGTEHQSKLATVINNYDVLQSSMAKVNSEAAKNSAQKEYQKRLNSMAGELDVLKTNMSDVAITAGESLLPTFNELLKAIIPIIREVGNWIKSHKELVKDILSGIAVLVGMKLALMPLMTGIGIIGDLAKAFKGLKLAITGVRGAFTFLASHPIVAAIIALITVVVLLYLHWDKVKEIALNVWESIKVGASSFVSFARNAFNSLIDGIVNRFIWLYNKAREVWTGIKSIFSGGNLSANANVKATIDNLSMRNTPQIPQAALSSYQQTYNSAVNNKALNTYNNAINQQKSSSTKVDQKVTIQVAPNNSATQAQDIHKELEAQYRGTMRLAGTGFR